MFKSRKEAIGILGGTFDPIHLGHLRLALEVQQSLELDHIRMTPCYQPVHRSQPAVSAEHRLAMLQQAVELEAALQVDEREIHRHEPSYTIDTLTSLKADFDSTNLCLIMGNDAFLNFTHWHKWEEILEHAHVVVAHRPHFNIPAHSALDKKFNTRYTQNKKDLFTQPAGKIYFQKITSLEISATDIREQIENDANPRYLLPEAVFEYIRENKLYTKP